MALIGNSHNTEVKMLVCINGKFIEDTKACVSIYDRGFLYADGIFDTLTIKNGAVLWFADYYARIQSSAAAIFLQLPCIHSKSYGTI